MIKPGVSVTVGNRSGYAACIDGAIFFKVNIRSLYIALELLCRQIVFLVESPSKEGVLINFANLTCTFSIKSMLTMHAPNFVYILQRIRSR